MKTFINRTVLSLAAGVALILLNQACTESKGGNATIPKTTEPTPVRVISLEKEASESVINTSGRISTDDETLLAFKIGGIVRSVFVNEGDAVKQGQLLATLDPTEINSAVAQAKFGLEKAERDLSRAKNLYKDSVATLEQLQNAQTAYELAQAQLNAVNFNRSFSEIRAPFNGYVLKKFVNAGQVIGIGDPVLKTNGAGSGNWILKAGVSDKQWSAIQIKDKAKVKIDAFPGEIFEGMVLRKSGTSDPATGSFTVEVRLNAPSKKIASGMFATVEVISSNKMQLLNLPYEAVLEANGDEAFVFVTNDNRTAERIPVTIGSFDNESIQVVAGLENAKALIIAGSAYLSDESPIVIVK